MTILDKKSLQNKQDAESNESTNHLGAPHNLQVGTLPNLNQDKGREERHGSPGCWQAREEKRSPHHTHDDAIETGPSHSKRRHKASPLRELRSNRNKTRDRTQPGSSGASTSYEVVNESGDNDCGGYNSSDEYDTSRKSRMSEEQWREKDRLFEKRMRKRGYFVKNMSEDGACLFRAVADQVYGDQEMHPVVRKHCMDYMARNSDYFSQYVTEDFNKYLHRKRQAYTHGNHIEMQAMSEIYNRRLEVFSYGKDPINIFRGMENNDNEPIRLSYQRGHYNSIVDPHKATVGVGSGLPGFVPGSSETNLIKDALRQSEDLHIEQAMLEDKLRATDWEATNEAIEEQVARESYLQWLRDNEKRGKEKELGASSTASINLEVEKGEVNLNPTSTQTTSPCGNSCHYLGGEPLPLPNQLYGLSEWEDDILAQVLAASQQEYFEALKKSAGDLKDETQDSESDVKPSTSR